MRAVRIDQTATSEQNPIQFKNHHTSTYSVPDLKIGRPWVSIRYVPGTFLRLFSSVIGTYFSTYSVLISVRSWCLFPYVLGTYFGTFLVLIFVRTDCVLNENYRKFRKGFGKVLQKSKGFGKVLETLKKEFIPISETFWKHYVNNQRFQKFLDTFRLFT